MKRSNSGLTWIRQTHVQRFLSELALNSTVSHSALDELAPSRTREFMRDLLVAHGALPHRDRYLAKYEEWASQALTRITNGSDREVIHRYIAWHHLRRMNQMDAVPQGTFLRSKQTVTVAIEFVNWLRARGRTLGELTQEIVDEWVNGGPETRLFAGRFLAWADRAKVVPQRFEVRSHRRGSSKVLSVAEQEHALSGVVTGPKLALRDRAVAILVLVFGQQMVDVASLTWDHVNISPDVVTIRLGSFQIELPPPLDEPWRELANNPPHDLTASHPDSPWVFRGTIPGRHIDPAHLRERLRTTFRTRAARLGTLRVLAASTPVAILAEALGYSPATVEKHATAAGSYYAAYIDALRAT